MQSFRYRKTVASGDAVPVYVDGIRSAFVKSFGDFAELDSLELFSRVLSALLRRVAIHPHEYDAINAGVVVPQTKNPNLARDAILNLNLPPHIHGATTNMACVSSLHTIAQAAATITQGSPALILAGGVELLSKMPITYSPRATEFLIKFSRARKTLERLKLLKTTRFKDWLPRPPSISEPLTGLTMGQHAEQMAQRNNISRTAQDRYALNSHAKAYAGRDALAAEITPMWVGGKYQRLVQYDDLVRSEIDLATLARLRPAFDRKYGTITAASSSPLTDGAAITLIADQKRAKSLGLVPRAKIVDHMFVGINPYEQLLIAPALIIPALMRKHKLTYKDVDLFEVHEAFAAQVLSCQQALASKEFCQQHFGDSNAIGAIPEDKLNVNGGAIAIGHPFGASGARLVMTMVNELHRRDKTLGLIAGCAAGGMGAGMLIERIS
ncbi:MAG: acetyl-CoA C-acyltransferase [Pseudomonadota bacterium]|nr:acetyl-CoA C-acyltransferase [Pseudomonadota bacterium]